MGKRKVDMIGPMRRPAPSAVVVPSKAEVLRGVGGPFPAAPPAPRKLGG